MKRSVWAPVRSRRAIWVAVVMGFGFSVITQPITSVVLPSHFRSVHQPQLYGFAASALAVGSILAPSATRSSVPGPGEACTSGRWAW